MNEKKMMAGILNSMPFEIFLKDLEGRYLYVNETVLKNDKLSQDEILGKKDSEIYPGNISPMFMETDRETIIKKGAFTFTQMNVNNKYLDTYKTPFYDDGNILGVVGYSIEETANVRQLKMLKKEVNKYKGLFEKAPLGVAIYHTDTSKALEFNPAFGKMLGRTSEELLNLPWAAYSHPDEIEENHNFMSLLIEKKIEGFQMEKRYIKADGSEVWVQMTISRYQDEENENAHLVMVTDITDKKKAEAELVRLANHDQLTGVLTRRAAEQKIQEIETEGTIPVTVVVTDINGLKIINDTFGHQKGDQIIKSLAELIKSSLGEKDIIARMGGDEFLIIMPKTSLKEASEKILEINEKIKTNPEGRLLSASFGTAAKISRNDVLEDAIISADARMYLNKMNFSGEFKRDVINYILEEFESANPQEKIHAEKTAEYALKLAHEMDLDEKEIESIALAARYHDIGKIKINSETLKKKDKLDADEWSKIMAHPGAGYQIMKGIPEYYPAAELILHHHERFDGKGYPEGKKGEEIPLGSQIISLAGAYVDMTMDLPYRKKRSKEEAITEIKANRAKQFDSALVKIFLKKVLK